MGAVSTFGYHGYAAVNTSLPVFVWMYVLISLGCIPRSGIAGTCVNSIFNYLKDCQIAVQSSNTVDRECLEKPARLILGWKSLGEKMV